MSLDPFLTHAVHAALEVARAVRVLGAATPRNAAAERKRLAARYEAGEECLPEWQYAPEPVTSVLRRLDALEQAAHAFGGELGQALVARLRELTLEARLMASVGQPDFARLAEARYPAKDPASDVLARRWLRRRPEDDGAAPLPTDDPSDARSLLCQIRQLVGKLALPMAVTTTTNLSSLAAVGERTIYVARGRTTTERAARRTAIHEVYGHALPRARASAQHPIFALGTARGADDQEGLALFYEERAGLLCNARRAELARRHLAAAAMRSGASFIEVVRTLRGSGATLSEALLCAERVYRGSTGTFAGLGRESVYLASFRRVRAHLRAHPEDEIVLGSGQIAVAEASRCGTQFAGRHALPCPPPTTATG